MSSGATAVLIVVVVIVIAVITALAMAGRRRRLQQRFGPEYDRTVEEQDNRFRAEAELTQRQRRVRKLDIQPLSDAARARYQSGWQTIQEQFVDAPENAVTDAYTLVTMVMRERGYPATGDDEAMADLSVDHASTLHHFRAAHEITRNVAHGSVETEEMRQALIHYRELFTELLGEPVDLPGPQKPRGRHAAVPKHEADGYLAAPGAASDGNTADAQAPDLQPEIAQGQRGR